MSDEIRAPEGARFRCAGTRDIWVPHRFCVTDKHVAYASKHHHIYLTPEDIEASGAPCGVPGCTLSHSEHKPQVVLVVVLQDKLGRRLNEVEGLGEWLVSIKPKLEELGIEGIIFPSAEQFERENIRKALET